MHHPKSGWVLGVASWMLSLSGCGERPDAGGDATSGTASDESTGDGSESGEASGTDEGSETDGPKLDVGFSMDVPGEADPCSVEDMDAPVPCDDEGPPDSFEPELQWAWGDQPRRSSSVVPLVANLSDDDDSGSIDLCDTPDVVLNAYPDPNQGLYGELVALDGATGEEHWSVPMQVRLYAQPALGDVDGDGLVEIVVSDRDGHLMLFEHDGTVAWVSPEIIAVGNVHAPALADLDNDGDVEIVVDETAVDHEGEVLWVAPSGGSAWGSASAIADLDGDDDMEVLVGAYAYHHDGSLYYDDPGVHGNIAVFPQVADLDQDGLPEVLLAGTAGLTLLEHDGTVKWMNFGGGSGDADRPANVHDFDGDDLPEIGASALMGSYAYGVYETTPAALWTGGAVDQSGQSGGTAFDFLGTGAAQAIYADETTTYVYDEVGNVLLSTPRSSLTQLEYPVVADVDDDGSAEILVVSNPYPNDVQSAPGLQVFRDVEDRWVQARRIWNQHTYHVTNVREDGTIPTVEPKHWEQLNTFRTQAQIVAGGGVCDPEG